MDNKFMSNLQTEGEAFDFDSLSKEGEEEKEAPPESAPENKPTEEPESSPEPKEEEPAQAEPKAEEDAKAFYAFHEHPRWKAREEELKQLREQVQSYETKFEEYEKFKTQSEPLLQKLNEPKSEQAPQWFTSLYGDNQEAWHQYQDATKAERKQIREEILNELKPDLDEIRSLKEQRKVQDWANKQWEALGKDEEVSKDLKSLGKNLDDVQGEISEVMSKYRPSDEDGNISLKASFELWKATRKQEVKPNPAVAEKKKIAAVSKPKESEGERDYRTSADFKGKSIHDLID